MSEPMSAWADGHPYRPREDGGFGCERCGRGVSAPVHRRYLTVARPVLAVARVPVDVPTAAGPVEAGTTWVAPESGLYQVRS